METSIESIALSVDDTAASGTGAVSWAAIFGGAAGAAALSLILFILGIGLGLGAVSPWSDEGISSGALGAATIVWITFTSLVASGLGGYLTGRLRTRWIAVHSDEVYFRDTAHGFLAWAIATLLTAVIFTASTAGLAGMGAQATAAVAGAATDAASSATAPAIGAAMPADEEMPDPLPYHLDVLFRTSVLTQAPANAFPPVQPVTAGSPAAPAADAASADAGNADAPMPAQQPATADTSSAPATSAMQAEPVPALAEVTRIFVRALGSEQLPQADRTYVARLVARHTGISAQEAEMRVDTVFGDVTAELQERAMRVRQAADEARATSAKVALWFFVALLAGAFTGSYAATLGGRQRDL